MPAEGAEMREIARHALESQAEKGFPAPDHPSPSREAAETAIEVATEESLPWVLDPVMVDRSEARAAYARTLVARRPRAIRLNRAELATLSGVEPDGDGLIRYTIDALTVIGLTGE